MASSFRVPTLAFGSLRMKTKPHGHITERCVGSVYFPGHYVDTRSLLPLCESRNDQANNSIRAWDAAMCWTAVIYHGSL
ncbi:hypothetical protein ATANTOWER_012616 [Ataeniobius toweri]|uniref:Uncharacterized protein n=1 Tax=Ataeniobius toweri TaxID=208326 RepID=A0ABU7B6M2_9TELE|nr:hypothetical protein [Ataeniobius toweri]